MDQGKDQAAYHFLSVGGGGGGGGGCALEGALERHFYNWPRTCSGKCGTCHPLSMCCLLSPAIETSQKHHFRLTVEKTDESP